MHALIAERFTGPEPRSRALVYVQGLLSAVARKNGWQLTEQAGDQIPHGI
jgi:hypothetical protein